MIDQLKVLADQQPWLTHHLPAASSSSSELVRVSRPGRRAKVSQRCLWQQRTGGDQLQWPCQGWRLATGIDQMYAAMVGMQQQRLSGWFGLVWLGLAWFGVWAGRCGAQSKHQWYLFARVGSPKDGGSRQLNPMDIPGPLYRDNKPTTAWGIMT